MLEKKKRHQQTHHARIGGKDFTAGLRHKKLIVLCDHMVPLSRDRFGNDQMISFDRRDGPKIVQRLQDRHLYLKQGRWHRRRLRRN